MAEYKLFLALIVFYVTLSSILTVAEVGQGVDYDLQGIDIIEANLSTTCAEIGGVCSDTSAWHDECVGRNDAYTERAKRGGRDCNTFWIKYDCCVTPTTNKGIEAGILNSNNHVVTIFLGYVWGMINPFSDLPIHWLLRVLLFTPFALLVIYTILKALPNWISGL